MIGDEIKMKKLPDRLLFLGEFNCPSGMLEADDPLDTDYNGMDAAGGTPLLLRGCAPGTYSVYYEFDRRGNPGSVYILHNSFPYHRILQCEKDFCLKGVVSAGLSGCMAVVDTTMRNDASSSFYEIEENAYYNAGDLLAQLAHSPYSKTVQQNLRTYLNGCISSGRHAEGSRLSGIITEDVYWNGFRSGSVHSSHWAVDVCNRVREGYYPFAIIPGGAVFAAGFSCSSVFIHQSMGSTCLITGIRISFKEESSPDFPKKADKIIPFSDNAMK